MTPDLKSPQQLQIMQQGGHLLAAALKELVKKTQIGMQTLEIDHIAEKLLRQTGGTPSFQTVPRYQWSTCINLNDSLVHGVPNHTVIQEGDLVTIDIGLLYKGLHTDLSTTFQIGTKDAESTKFLEAGQTALNRAIKQVKPGRHIGHISQAIQETIEAAGYQCVPQLIGHGVGKNLHEYPPVPGVLSSPINTTPLLNEGLTIAIEVIYVAGSPSTVTDSEDKWTIRTQDGKISGVFEKTIAVVSDGCLVLTR